jgi:hypothetical protein
MILAGMALELARSLQLSLPTPMLETNPLDNTFR